MDSCCASCGLRQPAPFLIHIHKKGKGRTFLNVCRINTYLASAAINLHVHKLHICVYYISDRELAETPVIKLTLLTPLSSNLPSPQRNSWVIKSTATASSFPSPSPLRPPSCSPTTSPCSSKAPVSPCLPTFHLN